MTHIGIIIGSTRPGRRAALVGEWVQEVAVRHAAEQVGDVTYELLDLADFDLPLLDEPAPAIAGSYSKPHTQRWADAVRRCDGFVLVSPEYNHSAPAVLKNAIDYLFAEWNHKAAGFVTYGLQGGTRAAEHLRVVLGELKMADVRSQVGLSMFTDFVIEDPTEPGVLRPGAHHEPTLTRMLDEIREWSDALEPVRARAALAGSM